MTLGVARFLRHVFSDCFNAEKPAKRGPKRNKSAHRIIVGYLGAVYTSIVLGSHPVPVKLRGATENCFLSLRVFVKMLQNESWRTI